jgi:hypothetical protein
MYLKETHMAREEKISRRKRINTTKAIGCPRKCENVIR